jgi:hypothetical protein
MTAWAQIGQVKGGAHATCPSPRTRLFVRNQRSEGSNAMIDARTQYFVRAASEGPYEPHGARLSGAYAGSAPAVLARLLTKQIPDRLIWHGNAIGSWWATQPRCVSTETGLIEATNPDQLAALLQQVENCRADLNDPHGADGNASLRPYAGARTANPGPSRPRRSPVLGRRVA